jgi:O-methyltransferase
MQKLIKTFLRRRGWDIVPYRPQDIDGCADLLPQDREILARVLPFTMTSGARLAALMNAVDYLVKNSIPGSIAECGVWRGGSMMAVALALMARNDVSRSLYLFDTFEGMSEPSDVDLTREGIHARPLLKAQAKGSGPYASGIWCYASLDDVKANLHSTGYPAEKIHFVKGKVEETIPNILPGTLSLLRLDTDFYESTKHELEHLFPLLTPNGVLIIDDYGAWQGARKAVDDYFTAMENPVFLHRIDETGRMMVRTK